MKSVSAIAVLTAALLPAAAAQGPPAVPDRQIVTGEEIRAAGVLRLSDLFRLIDGWTVVLRDGWHADATAGALDVSESGTWELWVDGHRAGVPIFGSHDINQLPIAPDDIDYVEAVHTPILIAGVFAARGLLHIHTRAAADRTRRGLRVRGSAWIGNETGDSGPLRFLGDDTPNVDHLGPDHAVSTEFASWRIRLHAAAVHRKHYPTDASIRSRHLALSASYPTIELYGAAGQAHFFARGTHHLAVQATRLDDFFFLRPYGREIPARTMRAFAGAHGRIEAMWHTRLHYRLSFARSALLRRPNPSDLAFDWEMDQVEGSVEWARQLGMFDGTVSLSVERRHVFGETEWTEPFLTRLSGHVRLARARGARLRPAVVLQVRAGGDAVRLGGMIAFQGLVGSRHAFHTALSVAPEHPADEHPLWFWMERGYELLDALRVDYAADGNLEGSRDVTWDGRWRTTWSARWSSTGGAFLRSFSGRRLEIRNFAFDPNEVSFAGPVRLAGPFGGGIAGIEGALEGRLGDGIRQRLHLRIRTFEWGSSPLRDALARFPVLEVCNIWFVSPAATFTLSPRLAVRSGTRWTEYAGADVASAGAYRADLPWMWTFDLTLRKSLWNRRIFLTADLRNLLNRPHVDHPIGASYDLSLAVRLAVRFGT